MLATTEQLLYENRMYSDPKHRIHNMTKKGELIPLRRGMYETDANTPGYLLANVILGPSYLSFEYALSYYNMIPERVITYTSAVMGKNKIIEFTNSFGTYKYRNIPSAVFPYNYTREIIDDRPLLIATKEKALCDYLYTTPPIRGLADFKEYLFDGVRLDEDEFENLRPDIILKIAPLYHKTNLDQLIKMITR